MLPGGNSPARTLEPLVFGPSRIFFSFRPHAAPALLLSAAVVATLFAATPFLIPEVADRYEVAIGTSGLISAAQVGGFAAAAFVAGRRFTPSRRILTGAAIATVLLNALSAVNGVFVVLLGLRLAAGVAAGLLVWLAWVDAMGQSRVMRDVAAAGPLTIFMAAPVLGWVASMGGDRAVYWVLAAIAVPAALVPVRFTTGRIVRRRMSPARSNVVLLVALGVLTMAGSSLFVFAATVAQQEADMGDVAVAFGFSLNALAGFAGARTPARPGSAWMWMLGVAVAASSVVVLAGTPVAYYLSMVAWGFCFWMAVPDLLRQVAEWSLVPEERVGDAQSVMALGRAVGPAVGGFLVGAGTFGPLAAFAGTGVAVAAAIGLGVVVYRRDRVPPTG